MRNEEWPYVRPSAPCTICGKPDWCQVSPDGGMAKCRRVESDRPNKSRDAWFHPISGATRVTLPPPAKPPPPVRHEWDLLARGFASAVNPSRLQRFARELAVSAESLERLEVGWSHRRGAWSFPMRDPLMHVRGIRLRTPAGDKFAIKGGHEGLFIPRDLTGDRLFICEGPTDTAALLDLGLAAIGRPSCTGGVPLIVELLKVRSNADVVIVADGDAPGQRGADILAGVVRVYCAVKLIAPPAGIKDARDWKRQGATAADVLRAVDAAHQVRLQFTLSPIRRARRQVR